MEECGLLIRQGHFRTQEEYALLGEAFPEDASPVSLHERSVRLGEDPGDGRTFLRFHGQHFKDGSDRDIDGFLRLHGRGDLGTERGRMRCEEQSDSEGQSAEPVENGCSLHGGMN